MKKWWVEPSFVYGLIFGLTASVLAGFLVVTDVFTFGVLGLFAVVVFFVAGAVVGSLSARFAKQRLSKKAKQLWPQLAQIGVDLSFDIRRLRDDSDDDDVMKLMDKHNHSIKEVVSDLSDWAGTIYLRMVAFGALFTMLGLMISFAVFWATFLQVSRLEEQIETTKIAKQVDIALSIASNYQFLVNGFIDEVSSMPGFGSGNQYLSALHYKRLESTLRQLKPYLGVDANTGELARQPNSPEQTFLLQYLSTSGVLLPSSKIQLKALVAHNLDIHHGEFASVDFSGSDLSNASFYKTVLTRANFNSAILQNAQFRISSLNNADLGGAMLRNADFTGADVSGANFLGADLRGANFDTVGGWDSISSIKGARISGLINPPEGFVEWAMQAGAIAE